jgi:fatty-acyl-CoA synthase
VTIGDMLRGNARRIPNREALVYGEERISWGELDRSVNQLANGLLARGVKPGDRVAFTLANGIDIVRLYYAIAKIGCTSVPIMPRSVAREIKHIVGDVSAAAIIADGGQSAEVSEGIADLDCVRVAIGIGAGNGLPLDFDDVVAAGGEEDPEIPVDPDSIYAIQFTSGTTGAPKGCMLPHRNKVLSRMSMLTYVPFTEDDRALLFMPLTASLGADMLHTHVLCGCSTVLMSRFDPAEMLRRIEAERITVLYAMESTFDRLVEHEDLEKVDWASVRSVMATSATRDLRPGVARLTRIKSFRAELWNGYGSSEGGGWLTFTSPADLDSGDEDSQRSIGRECMLARVDCLGEDGRSVPTGEIGELVLSAPWLFAGYWGMPDETAEALRAGRYHTGDLARKDETGRVFLEGRMKDMIKTGGVSVYPAEIEMVLAAHPHVAEVAVVGVTDPKWGEKVVACVIPEGVCEEDELIAYCKQELAGYKVPKAIFLTDDFPRDPVGKILKRELREQVGARFASAH